MKRLLPLLTVTLILAFAAPAQMTYLPLIQAAPGVAFVADVAMPFGVLNGVEPSAFQDRSGAWYISVYRIDDNNAGAWVVKWREGESAATPVGGVLSGAPTLSIQGATISNGRGTLALSYDRTKLYFFGWQGDSRNPKLRVARITEYQAAP